MWDDYATYSPPEAYPGLAYRPDDCVVQLVWGGTKEGCNVPAYEKLRTTYGQDSQVVVNTRNSLLY